MEAANMKAVVLKKHGEVDQLALEQVSDPSPAADEVRIQIKAAGFNPVDTKIRKGVFSSAVPVILGADCSGVIDAVGKGVRDFRIGDEVYALAFGRSSNGTYAEKVCLPTHFVHKKPKNLSFEQAACVPLVSLTAYRALVASRALQEGKSVFISGATGAVGSIALQMLKILKAGPIFATAGNLDGAQSLSLPKDHILLYKGMTIEEMAEKLVKMNGGELFHTTCDFVGREMKKLCFAIAGYQGHVVSIVPEGKEFSLELWHRGESIAFAKSLSVHFVFVGSEAFSGGPKGWESYRAQLAQISKWIEQEKLHIPMPTVLKGLSVDSVTRAHQLMEQGKAKGKIVMLNLFD